MENKKKIAGRSPAISKENEAFLSYLLIAFLIGFVVFCPPITPGLAWCAGRFTPKEQFRANQIVIKSSKTLKNHWFYKGFQCCGKTMGRTCSPSARYEIRFTMVAMKKAIQYQWDPRNSKKNTPKINYLSEPFWD